MTNPLKQILLQYKENIMYKHSKEWDACLDKAVEDIEKLFKKEIKIW